MFEKGVYEGKELESFIAHILEQYGVRTWADLRVHESWCDDYPVEQRYKLVVIAADVTRGRLVRLPWDYADYGLDPDTQSVAHAIRASAAIPFYFEPVRMGNSYLVDGGMVANFPLAVLDQTGRKQPRWPTIGVNLSARSEDALTPNNTGNPYNYAKALLETIINARDRFYVDDPEVIARTIFVDTSGIRATDFDLTDLDKQKLYDNGYAATEKFLISHA